MYFYMQGFFYLVSRKLQVKLLPHLQIVRKPFPIGMADQRGTALTGEVWLIVTSSASNCILATTTQWLRGLPRLSQVTQANKALWSGVSSSSITIFIW